MHILIAPDSFKGTLSSREVCEIISDTLHLRYPDAKTTLVPIADGGEGTADAFLQILGGEMRTVPVHSPLGREISASYAILPDRTAVIETAAASGLTIEPFNDALRASTFGTGELIRDALTRGCRRIFLGLGGSATTDGGAGCAKALGARFLDENGAEIPDGGAGLLKLKSADFSALDPRLKETELTVLCDVTNPLFGPNGAAYVYARQKGADDVQIELLDRALQNLAAVCAPIFGKEQALQSGAGAAGGFGYCARAMLGGTLKRGIDCILDAASFSFLAKNADLVITGEGKMDAQSLMGKAPFGVAKRSGSTPVIAVVGRLDASMADVRDAGIRAVFETDVLHRPFEEVRLTAKDDLIAAVKKIIVEEFA